MSETSPVPDAFRNLLDDYLSGLLDEAATQELEARLIADEELRRFFVHYARMHTDLHFELAARQSGDRVLKMVAETGYDADRGSPGATMTGKAAFRRSIAPYAAAALVFLCVAGALWWVVRGKHAEVVRGPGTVAWLANAQDCHWFGGVEPTGRMIAGYPLKLDSGLVKVQFLCGASVVLEGPVVLTLLSGTSARLEKGRLTAHVPKAVEEFRILSPHGSVLDLGTEFGIYVGDDGAAQVYVFDGEVEAYASDSTTAKNGLKLNERQAARITRGRVFQDHEPGPPEDFVRAIVPPPLIAPRQLRLTFDGSISNGLCDRNGQRTGFTHRLSGTGGQLPVNDPNLHLNTATGHLELTTTRSDLNGQQQLALGEYLGIRLSDLGFTGNEDFRVSATIPNSPELRGYGQFGLYVGTRSDRVIRGGLLRWMGVDPGESTQFLVNNTGGHDTDLHKVGLLSPGTDLELTLQRTDGQYSLSVKNLSEGSMSTLTIRHPAYLDGESDLRVGIFGANPYTDERRTLSIKEFTATVWTITVERR
jgi:hypothetical protein